MDMVEPTDDRRVRLWVEVRGSNVRGGSGGSTSKIWRYTGRMLRVDELIRFVLEEAKKKFPSSPRVVTIDFETGTDSTGDDAVWIRVVLPDTTPASERHNARVQPIADVIRAALRAPVPVGGGPFYFDLVPYVSFMTESERRAIQTGKQ